MLASEVFPGVNNSGLELLTIAVLFATVVGLFRLGARFFAFPFEPAAARFERSREVETWSSDAAFHRVAPAPPCRWSIPFLAPTSRSQK